MSAVAADTHALLWYLKDEPRLSSAADRAFRMAVAAGAPIFFSAVSLIEICYLIEKGRLPAADWPLVRSAISNSVKTEIEIVAVTLAVTEWLPHVPRAAVPDMPDRIIAATALHLGVPLVSRDHKIQASSIHTIW